MKYKKNENFTNEQNDAVLLKGNNIIVSAGAGSGKTTVLKDRVLRILLDESFPDGRKVHINNLIILTFTKNSANEMKERIRKIINSNNLTEESNNLQIITDKSINNSTNKKNMRETIIQTVTDEKMMEIASHYLNNDETVDRILIDDILLSKKK
jgi:ATP-dependent helicase/nuclease subunit A